MLKFEVGQKLVVTGEGAGLKTMWDAMKYFDNGGKLPAHQIDLGAEVLVIQIDEESDCMPYAVTDGEIVQWVNEAQLAPKGEK